MYIQVNYDYRERDIKKSLDVASLAQLVIERESKPSNTEVSINFVENEQIRALNRDYRQIDAPTDVLSFECDNVEDDFSASREGPYELGDVIVAPDIAEKQSLEYELSFADELSLLVVHGLLHLCGYDHILDEDARTMESREQELLSEFWGRDFNRSGVGLS